MNYQLVDDGTLDTVFDVWDDDKCIYTARFSTEYAWDFRGEDGGLTDEGCDALGKEAIELACEMLGLED